MDVGSGAWHCVPVTDEPGSSPPPPFPTRGCWSALVEVASRGCRVADEAWGDDYGVARADAAAGFPRVFTWGANASWTEPYWPFVAAAYLGISRAPGPFTEGWEIEQLGWCLPAARPVESVALRMGARRIRHLSGIIYHPPPPPQAGEAGGSASVHDAVIDDALRRQLTARLFHWARLRAGGEQFPAFRQAYIREARAAAGEPVANCFHRLSSAQLAGVAGAEPSRARAVLARRRNGARHLRLALGDAE